MRAERLGEPAKLNHAAAPAVRRRRPQPDHREPRGETGCRHHQPSAAGIPRLGGLDRHIPQQRRTRQRVAVLDGRGCQAQGTSVRRPPARGPPVPARTARPPSGCRESDRTRSKCGTADPARRRRRGPVHRRPTSSCRRIACPYRRPTNSSGDWFATNALVSNTLPWLESNSTIATSETATTLRRNVF